MKNLKITVNGTSYDVQVEELETQGAAVVQSTKQQVPKEEKPAQAMISEPASKREKAGSPGAETVNAPMPGTIVDVKVLPGQNVSKGDVLVILEAMKMENEIMAPRDAVIASVDVNKGESVNTGSPLVSLQ